jgi:hypothetical protein
MRHLFTGLRLACGITALVATSFGSTITNPSFETGLFSLTTRTATGSGGSAATDWYVQNSAGGTVTTERCTIEGCPSGATPVSPADGLYAMHVTTTQGSSGIYKLFTPIELYSISASLTVVNGPVLFNVRNGSTIVASVVATTSGIYTLTLDGATINRLYLYSATANGTDFFADNLTTLTSAPGGDVPEPSTIYFLLAGGLLFAGTAFSRRMRSSRE